MNEMDRDKVLCDARVSFDDVCLDFVRLLERDVEHYGRVQGRFGL